MQSLLWKQKHLLCNPNRWDLSRRAIHHDTKTINLCAEKKILKWNILIKKNYNQRIEYFILLTSAECCKNKVKDQFSYLPLQVIYTMRVFWFSIVGCKGFRQRVMELGCYLWQEKKGTQIVITSHLFIHLKCNGKHQALKRQDLHILLNNQVLLSFSPAANKRFKHRWPNLKRQHMII